MNVLLFWLNWLTCGYPWQTTIFHRQMNEDPFFLSANVPQRYFCEITLLPAIYVHLSITCVYLCLYIMTIYSVVIIGICTYLILPRSASVHSIICCPKSSDHLLPCTFFKNEKRKQSAMSTRLLHQTFPTRYYAFQRHTQRSSNEPPSLRNFGLLPKIALALGSSTHTPFLPIARYKSNIEKVTIVSDYISFFLQFLRCL